MMQALWDTIFAVLLGILASSGVWGVVTTVLNHKYNKQDGLDKLRKAVDEQKQMSAQRYEELNQKISDLSIKSEKMWEERERTGKQRFETHAKKIDEQRDYEAKIAAAIVGLEHDRIICIGKKHIANGYITEEDYDDFYKYLYEPYKRLGGNGTAERIWNQIKELPSQSPKEEE